MKDIYGVAKRWEILDKIQFRVECLGAEWSDDTQLWTVRLKNRVTGEEFIRRCRILVSSSRSFRCSKNT